MDEPDFKPAGEKPADKPDDFEHRFLDFAFNTTMRIDAASTAYALKVPIADAERRLEDLAARDVLIREVDDEGAVWFRLPGRPQTAMVKAQPREVGRPQSPGTTDRAFGPPYLRRGPIGPAASAHHMAGLVLNLVFPGVGSIVLGKTAEGIVQLVLMGVGLILSIVLIGIPMCVAVWGWALATSLRALREAERRIDPASPSNDKMS